MSAATERNPDDLLTPEDLAAELKVTPKTVSVMLAKGLIPWVPVGIGTERQRRRVRFGDLQAYKRRTRGNDAEKEFQQAKALVAANASASRGPY